MWPGAILLDGEVRGIWRRAHHTVTAELWGRPSRAARAAVEAEATTLPLPGCRATRRRPLALAPTRYRLATGLIAFATSLRSLFSW